MFGASNRLFNGPEYLVDEGVIMVSVNYRLGPLGFLSLGTPDVSGNQVCRKKSTFSYKLQR